MTTQMPDICIFEGKKWIIDAIVGDKSCIPSNEDLEIETVSPHTANWSGRIDHFKVYQNKLYLFKVEVNLTEECKASLPDDLRREVLIRYEPMDEYSDGGLKRVMREYRFEYLVYDDLFISFTGEMHLQEYIESWEIPSVNDDYEDVNVNSVVLSFVDGILNDKE